MQNKPTPKKGILDIAPYVGGKSSAAPGVEPVKLSSNETPLGASPKAIAAYEAAAKKLYRYPDGGSLKLRQAISDVQKIPLEQIVCGAGSDELIGLLVHAYAGAGDEVLISEHGFLMYEIYARSFGATPVFAPEKNLCADVDALLARVTKRTKLLLLANPNNPTGSYISKSELQRLHKNLPPQLLLVVDGAYAEYAKAEDYSAGQELVESAENVVMLRTFSKIYGLAALRIGWAYAPVAVVDVLNRVRGPFNVSGMAIEAGAAAMRDQEFTEKTKCFNAEWLKFLSEKITALGLKVYPSIANFVLIGFKDASQASAANRFLMERGLIVREVGNYKLPKCLRISVGLEENNHAVVAALKDFLKS